MKTHSIPIFVIFFLSSIFSLQAAEEIVTGGNPSNPLSKLRELHENVESLHVQINLALDQQESEATTTSRFKFLHQEEGQKKGTTSASPHVSEEIHAEDEEMQKAIQLSLLTSQLFDIEKQEGALTAALADSTQNVVSCMYALGDEKNALKPLKKKVKELRDSRYKLTAELTAVSTEYAECSKPPSPEAQVAKEEWLKLYKVLAPEEKDYLPKLTDARKEADQAWEKYKQLWPDNPTLAKLSSDARDLRNQLRAIEEDLAAEEKRLEEVQQKKKAAKAKSDAADTIHSDLQAQLAELKQQRKKLQEELE